MDNCIDSANVTENKFTTEIMSDIIKFFEEKNNLKIVNGCPEQVPGCCCGCGSQ